MIAVIADDFTGAAELGGIGLTRGLDVEIAMEVDPASKADLLVIATDSRSVSEPEAVFEMVAVSRGLLPMKPRLIFKKVDSMLRGHVVAETLAQLAILGLTKALVVPANPALGRTLVDGHYYVHGQPIHQTYFSEDPEFPITESEVIKRFSWLTNQLAVQTHKTGLSDQTITIGEVSTEADLKDWVKHINERILVGGGSGFFSAILDSLPRPKPIIPALIILGEHKLYVCGSAFGASVEQVKKAANAGFPVSYIPNELTQNGHLDSALTKWAAEILEQIKQHKQAIMAIESTTVVSSSGLARHLRTTMASAVKLVMDQIRVDELVIEGGSTASAVLRNLGIGRLVPTHQLSVGVVRSRAIDQEVHVTVKPGSYNWPPELWTF